MNVLQIPEKDLKDMNIYCWQVLLNHFNKEHSITVPVLSQQYIAYPVFITIQDISNNIPKLRGCIGTFEKNENKNIFEHLKMYTLKTILEDTRFSEDEKIKENEIENLELSISLLGDDIKMDSEKDWEIGVHGIKFNYNQYISIYLPEVAVEQNWTKQETIESLIQKSGFFGEYNKEKMNLLKYETAKHKLKYAEFLNEEKSKMSYDDIARILTYFGIGLSIII